MEAWSRFDAARETYTAAREQGVARRAEIARDNERAEAMRAAVERQREREAEEDRDRSRTRGRGRRM